MSIKEHQENPEELRRKYKDPEEILEQIPEEILEDINNLKAPKAPAERKLLSFLVLLYNLFFLAESQRTTFIDSEFSKPKNDSQNGNFVSFELHQVWLNLDDHKLTFFGKKFSDPFNLH